jgi:hypothetical protein
VIKENNIAWAAGLFEGEGNISSQWLTDSRTGFKYLKIKISITSTDKDVVEKFCSVVNCSKVNGPFKKKNINHKDYYTWATCRRTEALRILSEFKPYLCKRRL